MDIKSLIHSHLGENIALYEKINPQFTKVLSTIGFDKIFSRASGISLFDDKGNEYLDFLSGYGVYAFGRNHPEIKRVLKEYLDLDFPNLIQMEAPLLCGLLAKRLIGLFGGDIRDKVFFTNSGTEAIEAAIKFSRCATGREKFLHWKSSFHGLTTGSLALNGSQEFRAGFGELLSSDAIEMNDLQALEEKLKTKNYAAFIFEPVQGKTLLTPDKTYLQEACRLCQKYGTLTIADEIQTGLGRTGKWLAHEHYDVTPDLVTLSKALSGGMVQIGALLYPTWIYEKVFSRMDRCVVHSSTFGKNNLGMVCGLTSLEILEKENLIPHAQKMGEMFFEKLKILQDRYDWIVKIRGKGLMIGIEFGRPAGIKKEFLWNTLHKIDKGLFAETIVIPLFEKHRILTQVSGHHQDILKLLPPLILQEKHIDSFVNALEDVLKNSLTLTGPLLKMGKNLTKHIVKQKLSSA